MLGKTWYFGLIRKYTTAVGTLFNDIYILRDDDTSSADNQLIKIPITYSVKEKVLARQIQDPNIDREYAMIAPMISFELLSIEPDPTRGMQAIDRIARSISTDDNKKKHQYNPVAYNFNYRVSIYIKNTSDGLKIIEQILPMFRPDITLTLELIPEMNISIDVPIVLNGGPRMEDQYDGSFKQRKVFIYDLSLTVKGYLFGPVSNTSIIKYSNASIYIPSTDTAIDGVNESTVKVKILATPGLTANGQPTTNSNNSISPLLINIDDDFGFCIDIEEY